MRATILPYTIVPTVALWAMVSIMAKGCVVALSTASKVFLILTTQLHLYSM